MSPMEAIDHRELVKRQVEACMEDYRQSLLDYAEWMEAWRKRDGEKTGAQP